MAWIEDGKGGWISDVGDPNVDSEGNGRPASPSPVGSGPRRPTSQETADAVTQAQSNGQVAIWDPTSGTYSYRPMTDSERLEAHLAPAAAPAPAAPTLPSYSDVLGQQPAADRSLNPYGTGQTVEDRLAAAGGARGGTGGFQAPAAATQAGAVPQGASAAPNPYAAFGTLGTQAATPGSQAPTADRSKIDPLLGGLSGYENRIAALAGDQTGLSVAEAQLLKSDQLAKLRAANELQQNQAGALGAARSARNRGDTALLERQAVGEQAYLGQEAQRQDVLRQAELEGNQGILRATEADADRRFKLDALKTAGDLGLNTAALETDLSKTDLASVNNWINNEFQQQGINKQVDQQQSEGLLNFTRDMAAIEEQYAALDQNSQQFVIDSELKKYGIDQQTYVALKTAADARKLNWGQLLTTFVGGAVGGAAGVVAKKVIG